MWIDRKVYEHQIAELAALRAQNATLKEQNVGLRGSNEWFMVRTTQLEKERALLTEHYMGVKLEYPDYRPAPTKQAAEVPLNIPAMLGSPQMFQDIGEGEFPDAAEHTR